MSQYTALIADDEPLLRDALARKLHQAWPELDIAAQARNGREALQQFEALKPDICFLDIHMPGVNGIDVARLIGRRAHLVFVTAFDQYAIEAFERGVLDYLVKPIELDRLRETVARLKERLVAQPALNTEILLRQLAEQLKPAPSPLRWLRVQVGQNVRLIATDDIDYLRSDAKYTRVAWRDNGRPAEALVRTTLKDLAAQLDPANFAQVHRAVVVNLHAVSHVTRNGNETADIFLKGRTEVLPVSRAYQHVFREP